MSRLLIRRRVAALAATAVAASLLAVAAPAAPVAAATVPAGFTDTRVRGFNTPTTVEWLPNGRIAVLEKRGTMYVGTPGGDYTARLELDVCTGSEMGLLGVAPDPAFLSNGYLYVYYSRPAPGAPGTGCVNRLSRFTMPGDGPVTPGSEVVLLDNISARGGNHNGGAVEFGGDGHLYVSVGDAGSAGPRGSGAATHAAQDLSLLNGKILRITRDGAPAPGNPLLDQAGVTTCATRGNTTATPATPCAEIFAWGLRNPWRIAFDRNAPGGARFFINDVGQGTYEEVDDGASANYGWPQREGACPQGDTTPCDGPAAGQVDPITSYGRELGTYITGGAFVPDGVWPPAYTGAYLFGDGGSGAIWVLRANGSVDYGAPFASGAQGLTDMTFGFDAAGRATLYYTRSTGELRAITPSGAPTPTPTGASTFVASPPFRAYDTQDEGPGGRLAAGTSRLVDTQLPDGATAALVNLTIADPVGSGYLKAWVPGGARPETSSVNADPGSIVANAAIVPLDADGRFIVETSVAARVIVDVMGAFVPSGGAAAAGRFVPLPSVRVVDTREPRTTSNDYTETSSEWSVGMAGGGFPDGEQITAYVVSVGAIIDPAHAAGWVGAYPGGGEYTGTSNVNVVANEVRANMVVVPADASGRVNLRRRNVADVVVDVLGYFTGPTAPESTAGRFGFVEPARVADTRLATPFGRLAAMATSALTLNPPAPSAAVVQNVTVVGTGAAGWLSTHPGDTYVPGVSSLNYSGPGQTRAVLAFTEVGTGDRVGYTSKADTDLVVDVLGWFSD